MSDSLNLKQNKITIYFLNTYVFAKESHLLTASPEIVIITSSSFFY